MLREFVRNVAKLFSVKTWYIRKYKIWLWYGTAYISLPYSLICVKASWAVHIHRKRAYHNFAFAYPLLLIEFCRNAISVQPLIHISSKVAGTEQIGPFAGWQVAGASAAAPHGVQYPPITSNGWLQVRPDWAPTQMVTYLWNPLKSAHVTKLLLFLAEPVSYDWPGGGVALSNYCKTQPWCGYRVALLGWDVVFGSPGL